jgi:hypothetical protein
MDTTVCLEYKETPTLPHFYSHLSCVYISVTFNMEYVTPTTSGIGSYASCLIP